METELKTFHLTISRMQTEQKLADGDVKKKND